MNVKVLRTDFASNPERKLDGAKFFLGQLVQTQNEPRALYHHATAALGCVRSLQNGLIHEFGKSYKDWLKAWKARLPEDDASLAKALHKLRDQDVHESGIELEVTANVTIANQHWFSGQFGSTGYHQAEIADFFDDLKAPQSAQLGKLEEARYRFIKLDERYSGLNGQEVHKACQRFVDLAEQMLIELQAHTAEGK